VSIGKLNKPEGPKGALVISATDGLLSREGDRDRATILNTSIQIKTVLPSLRGRVFCGCREEVLILEGVGKWATLDD
jgi:hypothetical protein